MRSGAEHALEPELPTIGQVVGDVLHGGEPCPPGRTVRDGALAHELGHDDLHNPERCIWGRVPDATVCAVRVRCCSWNPSPDAT